MLGELLCIGKKLFWSRERLVKHEFDCLGLWLGLVIRVYVKPFCVFSRLQNHKIRFM